MRPMVNTRSDLDIPVPAYYYSPGPRRSRTRRKPGRAMPAALSGIKVLEFSEYIAGPFAGMLLSDLGADVIKIEPPGGEPWRHASPFMPNESRNFISLNRGKRSLPLDLKRPEAREIVYKLLEDTDVVLVNARPDVAARLGIDYETLSAKRPSLVYCDNTAFGRTGPDRHRPGYDLIAQAVTGLMASEAKTEDGLPCASSPRRWPTSPPAWRWHGASAPPSTIARGPAAGRWWRRPSWALPWPSRRWSSRRWRPSTRDPVQAFSTPSTALRESAAPFDDIIEEYRVQRSPWRERDPFYRAYQASDGVIVVACLSQRLRQRLLDVLGLEDPRFEPGFDPETADVDALDVDLAERARPVFLDRTVADWLDTFDQAGVPAAPVKLPDELLSDDQVKANDLVVDLDHSLAGEVKMVGPILKMSDAPLSASKASPALGEDTADILAHLGYSPGDVQRLVDEGITQ